MENTSARAARAAAFDRWLSNARATDGGEFERPEHELLAEHYMMDLALAAMDEEARQLLRGSELRPDFWRTAVEFIGDFTHRVHRVKEEQVFFPALCEWGLLEPEQAEHLAHEHESLGQLTLELYDAIGESDWEKAFRVVASYLGRIRPHLEAEELRLLSPKLAEIPDERMVPIFDRFRAVERDVLGPDGRRKLMEFTQRLCRQVGLADLHEEVNAW